MLIIIRPVLVINIGEKSQQDFFEVYFHLGRKFMPDPMDFLINMASTARAFNLKITIVCSILLLVAPVIIAQNNESVNSAGLSSSNAMGSISWSVGDLVIETLDSESGTLSQGMQQVYVEEVLTAITPVGDRYFSVYPNPANDFIVIEFDRKYSGQYSFRLFDLNGTTLLTGRFQDSHMEMDISQFNRGVYFIQLSSNSEQLKLYRIVKQ